MVDVELHQRHVLNSREYLKGSVTTDPFVVRQASVTSP